jgi:electron transport protein HydN
MLQKDKEVVKAASKCDLCKDIEGGPACVRVCPNEALKLVNLNEEQLAKSIATAQSLYDSRLS